MSNYCATAMCVERPASGQCQRECSRRVDHIPWADWQAQLVSTRAKIVTAYREHGSVELAAGSLRMHPAGVYKVLHGMGLLSDTEQEPVDVDAQMGMALV